jgi:hypothetical protein
VPGFVAFFARAMIEHATGAGIDPAVADRAVRQLFLASGTILATDPRTPAEHVAEMIAYAGTTAAGLKVLEASDLASTIDRALAAATERARTIAGPDLRLTALRRRPPSGFILACIPIGQTARANTPAPAKGLARTARSLWPPTGGPLRPAANGRPPFPDCRLRPARRSPKHLRQRPNACPRNRPCPIPCASPSPASARSAPAS